MCVNYVLKKNYLDYVKKYTNIVLNPIRDLYVIAHLRIIGRIISQSLGVYTLTPI